MVELIWDGKYDKDGKRTAPVRVALPFQTVETVNESAQQRQMAFDLFSTGRDPEWRNRLIWGDKKYVLPALLEEFAGKVDLVYIDPPFATGADFSFRAQVGDETFEKEPSIIEQKAYRDTWGRGLDSFLQWFDETVQLLYDVLNSTGTIYVHVDWRVNSGVRFILDDIFGSDHFVNEIIWHYKTFQGQTHRYFARKHDTILIYSKTDRFSFFEQFDTEFEDTIDSKRWSGWINEKQQIVAGHMPVQDSRFTRYLNKWIKENNRQPESTDVIYEVRGQPVDSVWDMKGLDPKSLERVDYATQKPEALLERIINASSNPGDLVLDCFCGSGTTAAVAEKLGRRWITCDLGRFAIHTARKRLLAIENVKPFVVQNLGKYERQVWQAAEFGDRAEARLRAYRTFILDLYHAEPYTGHVWLHGMKGGRLVHVGTVDAPIAQSDVTQIAAEFRRAIGTGPNAPKIAGVDVLGWDFALDANETIRQTAQAAGIDVRFIKIPREVLEKKAVEQGDIQFFELAALSVDVKGVKRSVAIRLTDFMVPPDDVPADVIAAVRT